MADIKFTSSINTVPLDAGIKRSTEKVAAYTKRVQTLGGAMENAFKGVGLRLLSYGAIFAGLNLIKDIVKVRGEFQQLQIAFETMLDSKIKADKIMSESIALAQKTPFTLMEVTTNAKQLMAMGVSFEKVMGTLKNLGDVAAGVSVPLSRIAINYGQVLTLGRLQSREIRDFAMAGVPLVAELAKNLGKSKTEIMSMVQAGNIGAKEVEQAFQTMAGAGGKFYNLMEKQNASVTGQISNLVDKWQVMLNEIGKSNEGVIYGAINVTTDLIKNYEEIGRILFELVAIYGTYRAALIIISSLQSIQIVQERDSLKAISLTANAELASSVKVLKSKSAKLLATQLYLAKLKEELVIVTASGNKTAIAATQDKIKSATTAVKTAATQVNTATEKANIAAIVSSTATEKANTASKAVNISFTNLLSNAKKRLTLVTARLNDVMMNNPWTAIAIAVTAVAFVTYKLITADTNLEKAQKSLNDALKETKERQDDIVNDSQSLLTTIRSETASVYEQVKAYNLLISKYKFFKDFSREGLRKLSEDEFNALYSSFTLGSEKGLVQKNIDKTIEKIEKLNKFVELSKDNSLVDNIKLIKKFFSQEDLNLFKNPLDELEKSQIKLEGFDKALKKILKEEEEARIASLPINKQKEYYENELRLLKEQKTALEENAKLLPYKTDGINPFEKGSEFNAMFPWTIYLDPLEEKIKKTTQLINELRTGKSLRTVSVIDAEIKKLEGEQKTLSDTSEKWLKYEQQIYTLEQEKAKIIGDSEKALKDSKKRELELLRNTEESRIAIMKEGILKEQAQADQAHKERLDKINKDAAEFPKSEQGKFDEQRKNEEIRWQNEKTKITKDSQKEITKILTEAHKIFLDENEQEIIDINTKYDEEFKRLLELNASKIELYTLGLAKQKELEQASQRTALKLSTFYQKIFGDIELMGYSSLNTLVNNLQTAIDKAKDATDKSGNQIKTIIDPETSKILPLTTAEFVRFIEQLQKLKKDLAERNPFKAITSSLKDLKDAQQKLNDEIAKGQVAWIKNLNQTAIDAAKSDVDDALTAINKNLKDAIDLANEWADSLGDIFGDSFGSAMRMLVSFADGLSKISIGFDAIKAGTGGLGAVTGILSGLGMLVSLFDNAGSRHREIERRAENLSQIIETQNRKLERQIELLNTLKGIDRTSGEKSVMAEIQRQIDRLNELASSQDISFGVYFDYMERITRSLGKEPTILPEINNIDDLIKFIESPQLQELLRDGFNLEGFDQITNLIDEYNSLIDKRRELLEDLVQTSSEGIADVIAQGFAEGKKSEQDFADTLEEMMKNAVVESFKTKFLLEASKGFFDTFTDLAAGGLTPEKITQLQEAWRILQSGALAEWTNITQGMNAIGINFDNAEATTQQGLAGSIRRNITEETGTELAGLIRRQSDDLRVVRDYTKTGVTHLINIDKNTAETVLRLDNAIIELQYINKNTKQPFTGNL